MQDNSISSAGAHTPGPWPAPNLAVFELDRQPSDLPAGTLSLADYERARACVNACEGMEPQLLTQGAFFDLVNDYNALRAQRDELAAALRAIVKHSDDWFVPPDWMVEQARAALAKLDGGK